MNYILKVIAKLVTTAFFPTAMALVLAEYVGESSQESWIATIVFVISHVTRPNYFVILVCDMFKSGG